MSFPMPLVPPQTQSRTSIVLIIYTKTSPTPSKSLLGPLVLLVLGPLVEQEGDGGERWWSWLSQNALRGVLTLAATFSVRFGKGNVIPGMGMIERGFLQVGAGLQAGRGGGRLQALAAGS